MNGKQTATKSNPDTANKHQAAKHGLQKSLNPNSVEFKPRREVKFRNPRKVGTNPNIRQVQDYSKQERKAGENLVQAVVNDIARAKDPHKRNKRDNDQRALVNQMRQKSDSQLLRFVEIERDTKIQRIKDAKNLAIAWMSPIDVDDVPTFTIGMDDFEMSSNNLKNEFDLPRPASLTPETNDIVDRNLQMLYVTKNPFAQCIVLTFPGVGEEAIYNAYFTLAANESGPAYQPEVPDTSSTKLLGFDEKCEVGLVYLKPDADSTYNPHGNVWYAGAPSARPEKRMIFLSAGEQLLMNVDVAEDGEWGILINKWTPDNGFVEAYGVLALTAADNTYEFEADGPGYFGMTIWRYAEGTGSTVQVNSINYSSSSMTFGHRATPDLLSSIPKFSSFRDVTSQVVVTEVAPYVDRAGKIGMAVLNAGRHWLEFTSPFTTAGIFTNIVKCPINKIQDANTGIEATCKFDDVIELNFNKWFSANNEQILDSFYPLDKMGQIAVMATYVPEIDSKQFIIKTAISLHGRANSSWIHTALPTYDRETTMLALEMIASAPQISENPLHWKDITSAISKFAKDAIDGILKYGPSVLQGAKLLSVI